MTKLEYSVHINVIPEQVWQALWNEDNYKQWTRAFHEGSYYKAERFEEGGPIHFLTPDGHGMYSIIDKLAPNQELVFRHIGNLNNFQEMPLDEATKTWTNALESYQLTAENNGTTLKVTIDMVDDHMDYFNTKFPLALNEVKRISESLSK